MKKFILGKKIGMTQLFDESGLSIPVTVIEAGPCTVVQKKSVDSDGYTSVKVGFEKIAEKKLNRPDKGQFTKIKVEPMKHLKEFRVENVDNFEIGQEINVEDMFASGDRVDVSGISKGKGFAGTVKRFNSRIGRMSHGSKYHRRVGTLGAGTSPGRVFKGKHLPGHMGVVRSTVQNLSVVRVDRERNLLILKGSVPGPKGVLLEIRETVKA
jgi:large subunit ribosomal protein L3